MLPSNWLQFDSVKQTLYGIAVNPHHSSVNNQSYLLRASDKDGLYSDAPLAVTVNSDNLLSVSHTFLMTITTDLTLFTRDSRHIVWWTRNVTEYFKSQATDITVLNITGPLVTISWTNTSIIAATAYTCPIPEIRSVYQAMVGEDSLFKQSLPQYLISSISLRLGGICTGFDTTTPTTTTTIDSTTTTLSLTTTSDKATTLPVRVTITPAASVDLAASITIPVVIFLLILLVIVIAIIVIRRRKKYKGKSHFDGEFSGYPPQTPVLADEEAVVMEYHSPLNELYEDEGIGIVNDTFLPPPTTDVRKRPPPKYTMPPPFPAIGASNI